MAEKAYRLKATQDVNLMSVRAQIVRCAELGVPATAAKLAQRLTGGIRVNDMISVQNQLDAMVARGVIEEDTNARAVES